MASTIGDSAGSMRLARTLRNGSTELDRVERSFRRAVETSTSRGGFARAESLLRAVKAAQVNRLEYRMQDLAGALERHARWVDETERELRDLERRIRAWAAANPRSDDPTSRGLDASLITYWPTPLSFEWRDLANRLRVRGAWF